MYLWNQQGLIIGLICSNDFLVLKYSMIVLKLVNYDSELSEYIKDLKNPQYIVAYVKLTFYFICSFSDSNHLSSWSLPGNCWSKIKDLLFNGFFESKLFGRVDLNLRISILTLFLWRQYRSVLPLLFHMITNDFYVADEWKHETSLYYKSNL